VAFSILVPAFGLSAHTATFRDISTEAGASITLQDESHAGGSATRRSLRFVGAWSNALAAQRQVLDRLSQSVASRILSEETLVLIPRDRAQNLTQSLSDIQTSTNTTIEVFPSRGGTDADIALIVVTSGPAPSGTPELSSEEKKQNEAKAVARIKETLNLKLLPSDLPDESETSSRLYIPVAARFAGSVIGKNASVVHELENETRARIKLSREGTKVETPTEIFRFVTVEGSGAEIRHAYSRIMDKVEDAKNRARAEAKNGNLFKVPLSVPDHLIGVIIGRGGKVLQNLQDDTGTKIHIEHSGKDDRSQASVRLVEISGDHAKVEAAQKIIVERLTEALADQQQPSTAQSSRNYRPRSRSPSEPRSSRDRYPSRSTNQSSSTSSYAPTARPDPSAPQEEMDKMVVSVPIHQVGAVIGNRGSMVRQICEESGARIHIEGRDEIAPDAKERGVTITGTTSQVSRAFNLIQQALAESNEARAKAADEAGGGDRGGGSSDYRGSRMHQYQSSRPTSQPPQHYDNRRDPYPPAQAPGYGAPSAPPPHYAQALPPPGYGQPPPQSYYQQAPPPSMSQQPPAPYYGNYPPPRSNNPVQMPSLPPPHLNQPPSHQHQQPPPQQPAQSSQFDLRILSQLAKNLPPIGSGNITQITGSPPGVQPPPGQYDYR
jgi:transcription antitermination factor NusA-like protein